MAVKIANALCVSVEYLVSGTKSQLNINNYSSELKTISAKFQKLSEHDKKIVESLIDIILQETK